jgi:hypothetical protein
MLKYNIADRGCHLISVTDPYGRILGFLDRSRYFLFHVAPRFQTHYFSEHFIAPEIKPGPLDL